MKTKHRELFLLACYVAIIIPMTAGQVLCLGCCCATYAAGEDHACCCRNESDHKEHSCCSGSPDQKESAAGPNLAKNHTPCGCVDIPLSNSDPQLTEEDKGQTPSAFKTTFAYCPDIHSENNTNKVETTKSPPSNIGPPSNVVLLI